MDVVESTLLKFIASILEYKGFDEKYPRKMVLNMRKGMSYSDIPFMY